MVKQQLSRHIKVVQVYPFNNPVSKTKNKPVVMAGLPYVIFSKYSANILILSRANSNPYNDQVVGIEAKNKKQYYHNIIKYLFSIDCVSPVIEVHQDVALAVLIAKNFNNAKVSVIRHGPSLFRSFHDKIFFMKFIYNKFVLPKLTYVFCISEYTTKVFQRNYPKYAHKFITIYNTYGHLNLEKVNNNLIEERANIVTFVGKPLKFKGIFIFLNAVVKFLQMMPKWQAMIIGAKFSHKSKYGKIINKLTHESKFSKNQILLFESLPIEEVFNKMLHNKIVVIPCIVSEPFCLVALEAHIAGCIVVSSGRGALKEISGDYAYYLDKLNAANLLKVLLHISTHLEEAKQKAIGGYQYTLSTFNPVTLVRKLDDIRSNLMNNMHE